MLHQTRSSVDFIHLTKKANSLALLFSAVLEVVSNGQTKLRQNWLATDMLHLHLPILASHRYRKGSRKSGWNTFKLRLIGYSDNQAFRVTGMLSLQHHEVASLHCNSE